MDSRIFLVFLQPAGSFGLYFAAQVQLEPAAGTAPPHQTLFDAMEVMHRRVQLEPAAGTAPGSSNPF